MLTRALWIRLVNCVNTSYCEGMTQLRTEFTATGKDRLTDRWTTVRFPTKEEAQAWLDQRAFVYPSRTWPPQMVVAAKQVAYIENELDETDATKRAIRRTFDVIVSDEAPPILRASAVDSLSEVFGLALDTDGIWRAPTEASSSAA